MLTLLRSKRMLFALALVTLAAAATPFLLHPSKAEAHPLGNFTVNRYTRIEISTDALYVRYVLDMAEIPTFQERDVIDADGSGYISPAEEAAYLVAKADDLRVDMRLVIDGAPVELRPAASDLSFPPGQGGLDTQRVVFDFTAPVPEGWEQSSPSIEYRDDNYASRLGWREVVVRPLDGVLAVNSTVPTDDLSDELRSYPEDGISNPLNVTSVTFGVEPDSTSRSTLPAAAPTRSTDAEARAVEGNSDSPLARYADLIAKDRLSVGVVVIALLAAVGFGAIHALSPGHGKTIVAAYLVGSRGTARHALLLGLTVTATHTSSVYALGFVTLYLSDYILPENLYPWLGVVAGMLILAMGLSLFASRLHSSGLIGDAAGWVMQRLAAFGSPSVLSPLPARAGSIGSSSQFEHMTSAPETGPHNPGGSIGDHHEHRHGTDATHSHAMPGQDGRPVTWRGLVGLGIFGGLLPCPSAIVVMLSAIALHRVAFGLVLIVAFSVGLAGVLTLIGFLLVYAGRLSERLPFLRGVRLRVEGGGGLATFAVRAFPTASAAAVVTAGLVVTMRALAQQGML